MMLVWYLFLSLWFVIDATSTLELSQHHRCNREEADYLNVYLAVKYDFKYEVEFQINQSSLCCKAGSYNYGNESCCFGNISPLPNEIATAGHGCCNVTAYNKKNQECWLDGSPFCNETKVLIIPKSRRLSKVKSHKLDSKKFHCCGNMVYDESTHDCCASMPYNLDTHKCCQENVVPLFQHKEFSSAYYRRWATRCCANVSYDVYDKEGCCGGKVYNKRRTGCCQNTLYNEYTHQCCNKVIVPRTQGGTWSGSSRCCGNETYLEEQEICCDNKLYPKNTTRCCYDIKTPYNIFTEYCCKEIVPLATDLESALDRNIGCCHNTSYNAATSGCCYGKVYQKNTSSCCGGKRIYDTFSNGCCYFQIVPLASKLKSASERNAGCCGNVSYNRETSNCCDRKFYNKDTHDCCVDSNFEGHLYDKSANTCCARQIVPLVAQLNSSIKMQQSCCGNISYNSLTHACCDKHVVTLNSKLSSEADKYADCCGEMSFNSRTHGCCLDTLYNKSMFHGDVSCCHNKPYDTYTHQCCNDFGFGLWSRIWPKHENRYSECCGNVSYNSKFEGCCHNTLYNYNTHDCCQDKVVVLASSLKSTKQPNSRCCLDKSYGYDSICCEGNLYNIKLYDGCCEIVTDYEYFTIPGETIAYNKSSHSCCKKKLIALRPGENEQDTACCSQTYYNFNRQEGCCLTKAYNKTTHACCQGNLVPLAAGIISYEDSNARCCKDVSYNSDTHSCCSSTVVPYAPGSTKRSSRCCKNVSYNPDTHICCGSKLMSLVTESGHESSCCGNTLYNSLTHGCCERLLLKSTQVYDKKTHTCCRHRVPTNMTSSNGKFQYISYSDDNIVASLAPGLNSSTDSNAKCCGKVSITALTHDCCEDVATPLAPGLQSSTERNAVCCSNISINFAFHGCCKRKVYDKTLYTCCWPKIVPAASGVVKGESKCCGDVAYNGHTQGCCKNYADNKFEVFNKSTNACCEDKIVSSASGVLEEKAECCGEVAYNDQTHGCCRNRETREYELYNKTISTCCRKVVPLTIRVETGKPRCCREQPYDEKTHGCCRSAGVFDKESRLCCNGKIVSLASEVNQRDARCCGYIPYDHNTHGCCRNVVYNKTTNVCCQEKILSAFGDGKLRCCGGVAYKDHTHGCCGSYYDNYYNAYNKSTSDCCQAKIVPLEPGASEKTSKCCEYVSFSTEISACCENQVMPLPPGLGKYSCCGLQPYNATTHQCSKEYTVIQKDIA